MPARCVPTTPNKPHHKTTTMSAKSDQIRVMPLMGGRGTDAICTLLEIGGVRLILDCGCSSDTTADQIAGMVNDLSQIGGVHAVLLTHADIHHIGALPYLLGKNGLESTPVFCTSPVSKFGQVLLYDYALNKLVEGTDESKSYDFDDVDMAFSNSVLLKFNQNAVVPEKESIYRAGPQVSVCAISSGRTIGGAIWRIRCGPTEIVYMVDINLKKEIMLDGVNLEMLPATPALLLTDAGSRALASSSSAADASSRRTSKKEKDDNNALITTVMDTMRAGGNVLIPTETAGRALELMQVLGKHWYDQKLGLYHLVFLSHMAKNVPEFARMQLEWMSDSLGRGFYNGKPNPFDLPQIRFATSLREIERCCPGPKTVLATDGSLSSGLAKELLLKWGGDPRCRVVFVDSSDPGSLAAELRQKAAAPPVIATITRPLRVELVGAELVAYRAEQEKQRRAREEALQRKRRQDELSKFNVGGELVDDEEDAGGATASGSSGGGVLGGGAPGSADELARKRPKVDVMRQFLEPSFSMFETQEVALTEDEYGASIDDLHFRDIQSSDIKWLISKVEKSQEGGQRSGFLGSAAGPGGVAGMPSSGTSGTSNSGSSAEEEAEEDAAAAEAVPTKLVTTTMRVQFTCEFKELNLSGRADLKAVKTVVTKMTPSRLIILRGNEADCASMMSFAKTNNIEGFAPKLRSSVAFEVRSEKLRVQVPQGLLPAAMRPVRVFQTSSGALADTKCSVVALRGLLEESRTLAQEGTRMIKYQGSAADTSQTEEDEDAQPASVLEQRVALKDGCIGVVSVGEVTLNSLRQLIEASGTPVEYRIDSQGALLVCGDQVIVRKENLGDFAIEGPPVRAFYEARKALYQQFAFV